MKYFGKVGYVVNQETRPGVWIEDTVERNYYGDVTRLASRWDGSSKINENISINNVISIVADPFAYENFSSMRYIEYMGAKWKITNIEVQRPRLIINIGGLYNGE